MSALQGKSELGSPPLGEASLSWTELVDPLHLLSPSGSCMDLLPVSQSLGVVSNPSRTPWQFAVPEDDSNAIPLQPRGQEEWGSGGPQ